MTRTVTPERYFRLTWQVEIVLLGALVVTSEAARATVAFPLLILSLLLVSPYGRRTARWRRSVSFGLVLALVTIAADSITSLRGIESLVVMMIEMILAALPFMLLRPERPRSYWLATLTVAVVAVGSITFTQNPGVYLGFIAFTVVLLFNLNAANLYLPDATGQRLNDELPNSYFRQFMAVLPVGLVSAAVIFVVFPRARNFQGVLGALGQKGRIGYSGVVSLEGGGELEASQQVAMLVGGDASYLQAAAPNVLFRGNTLDDFDGVRWTPREPSFMPRSQRLDLRNTTAVGPQRVLQISQEPSYEQAVFYPGVLLDVPSRSPGMGELTFSAQGDVMRQSPDAKRHDYSVRVADLSLEQAKLDLPLRDLASVEVGAESATAPHSPSAAELAFDREVPEVIAQAEFFRSWRAEVGLSPDLSLAQAVNLLGAHFRSSFKASLDNDFSGGNALEEFLTKGRKGHCEYFATATAMLLRSHGVAARVVVGYKGGTYNRFIDRLEVRDANAHAWVEAYVPGVGWLPVDLTPPSSDAASGWLSSLRLYGTAMTFWFRRYVVDYDADAQRDIVQSLRGLATHSEEGPIDWQVVARFATPAALVLAGAGAFFLFVRRRARRADAKGLPHYFERFQALAATRGLRAAAGETHARFSARAREHGLPSHLVDEVDRAIHLDLYAPDGLSAADQAALESLVEAEIKVARHSGH